MGWYRKAKLAIDVFHNFATKISPKNLIRNRSNLPTSSFKDSGLLPASSIPRSLGFGFSVKQNQANFCFGEQRRFYHVDRYRVHHFRQRGPRKWSRNPRNVFIVVMVGSGVLVTLYFGNLETVPYTKRTHVVLLSKAMERKVGESNFEQIKQEFKGKILPAIHPESVRVKLISKEIIKALERGLGHEHVWSNLGYAAESNTGSKGGGNETLMALQEGKEANLDGYWTKDDEEVLDDKWVQQSRNKGMEKGSESTTHHLGGLNWEVLVVNEPVVNALCLPGGKIVVFTGLFEHFKSDAEIATIIGHEIGHAVARHSAELITKNIWLAILQIILYQFIMPDLANTMSTLLLRLPFSRRMEMEADYIGLLLLASAGYDPRLAPRVYEKLGKITGDSALRDYLSTHPSGKKRAQLLAQAQVMEEALKIHREVRSGHGVEGFL